jgi:hypothetical protein
MVRSAPESISASIWINVLMMNGPIAAVLSVPERI